MIETLCDFEIETDVLRHKNINYKKCDYIKILNFKRDTELQYTGNMYYQQIISIQNT